ncbi:MAG TPA: adenylate/guanylate cyclase domain-containing protein [Acidimicrobiia bacterium]|nr:adenylate/guanylate cyclase domain-containing protein [Acidimicrobiia bacterium]
MTTQFTGQSLPTGTVTFLFTDIEGSTRLVQGLGEGWVSVLDSHNELVDNAITGNGGIVVKTEGDSFFAVFPSASDALEAAVAAQRALIEHPWPENGVVRSRMGLHTGLGTLGGADYVGLDVHRAARIADAAHGGQIVLSEPTTVLVERHLPSGVSLRDLGKHRLKDLSEPEAIFQVVTDGLQTEFPLLRTLDAIPNNLPRLLTSFVGREKELAEAIGLLETTRILTFTGPGGTGKTRLSLQVAAELADAFPDGVFFVELAPVTSVDVVPSRILESLGIQASSREETPAERLLSQLGDKGYLIVLDNFEQLLDGAPLVADMVRASPRTKVLVTSRAPLRISGEQEMPVPPLGLAGPGESTGVDALMDTEAVRLFADRATSVRPDFRVTEDNVAIVAELVRRLDGLPLAIELVASRLRLLPVEQILDRLDARMLSSGSVDLPERQRTIQGTIAWSHDLLAEPERRLFARFSVFGGGARLEEVEAVCGPSDELGDDLLNALSVLVDHSLIRRVDSDGHPRLRMLHVIREYASERLGESGEADELRRRHAGAYATYVESVAPELLRKDRRTWLDLLEQDHDNIRIALDWTVSRRESDLALRIAAASWRLWQARGHLHEARARLDQVLALEGGEPRHRAKAMEALGGILWWLSDLEGASTVYGETLQKQRELGDPGEIANALYNYSLAKVYTSGGDPEEAPRALDEAESIYRDLGDVGGLGDVEWARGTYVANVGTDIPGAIDHMKKSIVHYREAGNEFGMGWGLHQVGDMARRIGDFGQAWENVAQGLVLFAGHRDVSAVVLLLAVAAAIARELGDGERGLRLAGAFHGLRLTSGTEIVAAEANRIEGYEFETLEALTGEAAIPYREGRAMSLDQAVAYALEGPTDK